MLKENSIKFVVVIVCCLFGQTSWSQSLNLSDYKDKVLYVDFWASWCVPCRKSFPWLESMHEKYSESGLEIITISLDKKSEDMEKFLSNYPISFKNIHDPNQLIAANYKIIGMPTSFIYNKSGDLIKVHAGYREKDKAALENLIVEHLSQ